MYIFVDSILAIIRIRIHETITEYKRQILQLIEQREQYVKANRELIPQIQNLVVNYNNTASLAISKLAEIYQQLVVSDADLTEKRDCLINIYTSNFTKVITGLFFDITKNNTESISNYLNNVRQVEDNYRRELENLIGNYSSAAVSFGFAVLQELLQINTFYFNTLSIDEKIKRVTEELIHCVKQYPYLSLEGGRFITTTPWIDKQLGGLSIFGRIAYQHMFLTHLSIKNRREEILYAQQLQREYSLSMGNLLDAAQKSLERLEKTQWSIAATLIELLTTYKIFYYTLRIPLFVSNFEALRIGFDNLNFPKLDIPQPYTQTMRLLREYRDSLCKLYNSYKNLPLLGSVKNVFDLPSCLKSLNESGKSLFSLIVGSGHNKSLLPPSIVVSDICMMLKEDGMYLGTTSPLIRSIQLDKYPEGLRCLLHPYNQTIPLLNMLKSTIKGLEEDKRLNSGLLRDLLPNQPCGDKVIESIKRLNRVIHANICLLLSLYLRLSNSMSNSLQKLYESLSKIEKTILNENIKLTEENIKLTEATLQHLSKI